MGYNAAAMKRSWTRFLHSSLAAEHGVQLYSGLEELVEPVGAYLAAGFDLSEPAAVVTTPEHRVLFADRLAVCGWDEGTLAAQGLVEFRDAEQTLDALLVDGMPSAELFERSIGALIDELSARFPGRQVRAFGEMVDILCMRGDPQAAAELEDLWNRLAERRRFSLLCAYHVDLFDADAQLSLLPQICGAHTHVQPGGDVLRLGNAVADALAEELGDDAASVYANLPRGIGRNVLLPAPERALMWISANLPGRAERILAAARARYAAAT
jgi:hypothetical protein